LAIQPISQSFFAIALPVLVSSRYACRNYLLQMPYHVAYYGTPFNLSRNFGLPKFQKEK
jgi:hypothetical protein